MEKEEIRPIHYEKDYFCSYWHQINEIINKKPKKVLEIGIAYGAFVSKYLRNRNIDVTTLDINKKLSPVKVGDILNIPFEDNTFDVVAAFEVLEHLPFLKIKKAIKEIWRVTTSYAIISLPDQRPCFKIEFSIFRKFSIRKIFNLSYLNFIKYKLYPGHKWEIGYNGIKKSNIKQLFQNQNFQILNSYRVFEKPYHHFFILKKV